MSKQRLLEKLVRDGLPEIIRARGETPRFRIASAEEMPILLRRKLREEVAEFELNPVYEELADVAEVLRAIERTHGVCPRELEHTREKKLAERGGFDGGVVLVAEGLLEEPELPGVPELRRAARLILDEARASAETTAREIDQARAESPLSSTHGERLQRAQERRELLEHTFVRLGLV